jgi:hypothetical protein
MDGEGVSSRIRFFVQSSFLACERVILPKFILRGNLILIYCDVARRCGYVIFFVVLYHPRSFSHNRRQKSWPAFLHADEKSGSASFHKASGKLQVP